MTAEGFDERLTMAAQRLVSMNCPLRLAWPAARMTRGSAPDRPLQPGAGRSTLLLLGSPLAISFHTSRFIQRTQMPSQAGCLQVPAAQLAATWLPAASFLSNEPFHRAHPDAFMRRLTMVAAAVVISTGYYRQRTFPHKQEISWRPVWRKCCKPLMAPPRRRYLRQPGPQMGGRQCCSA